MDRKTATRSIAASTSSSIPVPAPRYTSSIKDVKLPVPWGNRMTPKEYAGESKLSAGGAQWQSGPWLTLLGQLGVHRASSTSAGFAENPVQLDRSMYRMSVVETSVRVRLVNNATSRASVRESKTARCPRHHCNAVPHSSGISVQLGRNTLRSRRAAAEHLARVERAEEICANASVRSFLKSTPKDAAADSLAPLVRLAIRAPVHASKQSLF